MSTAAIDPATSSTSNRSRKPSRWVHRLPSIIVLALVVAAGWALPASAAGDIIEVPSRYVYDPDQGSLNDYCTSSPDEFPAAFDENADFRGPCANHDLCLADNGNDNRTPCDNILFAQLAYNCGETYGDWNPNRGLCIETAGVYWAAVTANTFVQY